MVFSTKVPRADQKGAQVYSCTHFLAFPVHSSAIFCVALQRFDALEEKLIRESGIFGTRPTGAAAEGGLQSDVAPRPSASRVTASSLQPSAAGNLQSHSTFNTTTEAQVAALYGPPL